jgi:serine/threonine protein phosphatase PrpC
VVDAAEQALADAGAKGCTTAILAKVTPDGRGRLASLGDSTAWLLRPHSDQPRPGQRLFASGTGAGWFAAWRLTPAHTVYAARLRADAAAAGGYSEITGFLGGAAGQPFLADFVVRPGDVLVLATDGATVERRGEWFGAALRDLAAARSPEHGPIGAGLASDLVRRAEDLGGWDNATALVVEFDPPPTDTAPARIAAPVKAAVPVKVAARPEEVDRTQ